MQVCLRLCGWILIQQDKIQIWLWIELKIDYQFRKHSIEGPQRCPIYLKLLWIGETSVTFEKKIKSSILNCFSTVQPQVIFTTRRILPAIHKDVLPASQLSMVVYQYVCCCECRYVGRTSQRLQDRICQHVPKTIHNKTNQERIQPTRKSKITLPQLIVIRLLALIF